MAGCPLLFTLTEKIEGDGFIADVEMRGRTLLVEEDGEIWMYGVQPGGIAAGGENEDAAYLEFRQTLKAVFFDISIDSADFRSFKRKIKKFFEEVSKPTEEEWWKAVGDVRKGLVKAEGIPRLNANTDKPFLNVERIKTPKAKHNVLEPQGARAVAA